MSTTSTVTETKDKVKTSKETKDKVKTSKETKDGKTNTTKKRKEKLDTKSEDEQDKSIFPYVVNLVFIGISVVFILLTLFVLWANYTNNNIFCTGNEIVDGLNPLCSILGNFIVSDRTANIGERCYRASQCIGYQFGGEIDCCNGICVRKNRGIDLCVTYCLDNPTKCGRPVCFDCTIGPDCQNWSPFGQVECINNRCVLKDFTTQSVLDFLNKYGSVDTWCETYDNNLNVVFND